PEVFAETSGVDNQRVLFPMPDGMPVGRRIEFLRMRPAIHKNNAKRVGTAYIEDIHALQIGQIHELDAIRSLKLTRYSRRMTSRVRFEFVDLAVIVERFGPRLKWNCFNGRQSGPAAEVGAIQRQPEPTLLRGDSKIGSAVGKVRRGLRGCSRS